jgi:5'-nucleotidase
VAAFSLTLVACAANGSPVAAPVTPGAPGASISSDAGPVAVSPPDAAQPIVHVQILAINDFHGHLEPPAGTSGVIVAATNDPVAQLPGAKPVGDAGVVLVPAGGAAYLATHIARLRAENPSTVVVSAGDLTGASPLLSNVFKDEPAILVMNQLGLDFEGVGNHDFDRGAAELQRLQHGGCSLGDCDAGGDAGHFPGASFTYLGANVIDDATQKTVFPPYAVRELGGVKVAFVGETLKETPSVAFPNAVKGLTFENEAKAANALVPELKKLGVSAIVLVLHQGGQQAAGGTYDSCVGFSGDVLPILDALDPAIDVVVSAHTHQAYDCTIAGRLVTSAGSYGRLVTKIDLAIDPAYSRVVDKRARNVPVTRDVVPDAEVERIIGVYAAKAAPVTARVVGYVKADFTGSARAARSESCETPLGDLIADAEEAKTGADFAIMNPGGIRADLMAKRTGRPDLEITYADAFEVQPFGNTLVTLALTGAQITSLLEAQFGSRAEPRILQVSKELSYRYTYDHATRKGTVEGVRVRGVAIDPKKSYRVTVNSFLAGGGDGFAVLKAAGARKDFGLDLDALTAYLGKKSSAKAPLEPARVPSRIQGDGCK